MGGIEFLDAEPLSVSQPRSLRVRRRVGPRLLVSSGGSLLVIVSVWLPQLSIAYPHSDVYQVDGWGHYSISRHFHGESQVSFGGSAPAVGASAFAVALITMLAVLVYATGRASQPVVSKVVLLAAGAIASSCACQILELHGFGPHVHWQWGLTSLALGALTTVIASLWPLRRTAVENESITKSR
jgi:hypothetical protein